MKKKGEKILFVELVRIAAILLVIGFHIAYELTLDESLRQIGFVGVSLFFIASGYILAKKYPHIENFSIKWFFKRYTRIASLYYPALIAVVILFGTQTYPGQLIKNLAIHFLFLDAYFPAAQYTIISPAWFLAPLMGLYLLFPYLNRFVKRYPWLILPVFALTVYFRIMNGMIVDYSVLFFIGEFCFGIALAYGSVSLPLLASAGTIIVRPVMFLPYVIFLAAYKFITWRKSIAIVSFISANTWALFLFHESIMKASLGKWSVYGLSALPSVAITVAVAALIAILSNKSRAKNPFNPQTSRKNK